MLLFFLLFCMARFISGVWLLFPRVGVLSSILGRLL